MRPVSQAETDVAGLSNKKKFETHRDGNKNWPSMTSNAAENSNVMKPAAMAYTACKHTNELVPMTSGFIRDSLW